MEYTVGQVVYSKSGHDKGKAFIVTEIEGEYLYLVDGKCRTIDKPKKKKLIHLQRTNYTELIDPDNLTNSQVRGILDKYKPV